jgi:hypothetical protein
MGTREDLQKYFNKNTALVFFDVKPSVDKHDKNLFKVVAYVTAYDPNLKNLESPPPNTPLPYRELFSQWEKNDIRKFKGNVSGMSL